MSSRADEGRRVLRGWVDEVSMPAMLGADWKAVRSGMMGRGLAPWFAW